MINELPLNFFAGQILPDERARIFRKFIQDIRAEITRAVTLASTSDAITDLSVFLLSGNCDLNESGFDIDLSESPMILELL